MSIRVRQAQAGLGPGKKVCMPRQVHADRCR